MWLIRPRTNENDIRLFRTHCMLASQTWSTFTNSVNTFLFILDCSFGVYLRFSMSNFERGFVLNLERVVSLQGIVNTCIIGYLYSVWVMRYVLIINKLDVTYIFIAHWFPQTLVQRKQNRKKNNPGFCFSLVRFLPNVFIYACAYRDIYILVIYTLKV